MDVMCRQWVSGGLGSVRLIVGLSDLKEDFSNHDCDSLILWLCCVLLGQGQDGIAMLLLPYLGTSLG